MLCRRSEEQDIGHSTALHAHDDQITLSRCGEAQNFAPRLSWCYQGLHTAELGRARNGFLQTPGKNFIALLQELINRHACAHDACHVGRVLEFVLEDVEDDEMRIGFLRHRHRILQCS